VKVVQLAAVPYGGTDHYHTGTVKKRSGLSRTQERRKARTREGKGEERAFDAGRKEERHRERGERLARFRSPIFTKKGEALSIRSQKGKKKARRRRTPRITSLIDLMRARGLLPERGGEKNGEPKREDLHRTSRDRRLCSIRRRKVKRGKCFPIGGRKPRLQKVRPLSENKKVLNKVVRKERSSPALHFPKKGKTETR